MTKLVILIFAMFFSCCSLYSQSGWYPLISGTSAALFSVSFPDSVTGYAVGINGVIRKTTNAGANWFAQTSSTPYWLRSVFFTDVNIGYIASGNVNPPHNGNLYKTTNGGMNWNLLVLPEYKYFYSLCFVDFNTGYASGFGIILKTTNGGSTWVSQSFPSGLDWFFSIYFIDAITGYACGGLDNETEIYIIKTTNGGLNWQTVYNNQIGGYLFGISFIDENTGLSVGGAYSANNIYVLRTTNGGNNWDQAFNSNQASYLYSVDFVSPDIAYASGGIEGSIGVILKTTNGGINWGFQAPNASGQLAGIDFMSENTGYVVGTFGKILKTTDGGGPFIGVKPISSEIPDEFKLFQNYPNPFNPATKIKFDVSKLDHQTSNIELVIYDVLGREVTTLVNEQLKPGTYEVQWDAANYPSGIYLYKLHANGLVQTRKMVLVK